MNKITEIVNEETTASIDQNPTVDMDFDYDELDVEEFVDIEYRTWINVFEDEFSEDELLYTEPDEYL